MRLQHGLVKLEERGLDPRAGCDEGPVQDGRTFALVVAHPDDDAFSWAGSVALHAADAGFRRLLDAR